MNQEKYLAWAMSVWQLLVGVVLSIMALGWVAYGATYNFYFNNTEQGPNSTANPTVTVKDGIVTGAENKTTMMGPEQPEPVEAAIAGAPAPAAAEAATPAPAPVAASSVAVAPVIEPESPRRTNHLRFMVGGGFVAPKETVTYPGYTDTYSTYAGYSYRSHEAHPGAKFELGFFGSRDVGINFFGGGYTDGNTKPHGFGGAELEIMPIHVTIGRAYELINWSLMLGATTLGRVDDNWVAAHAGTRLQFNIGDGWGLAATGRANLGFYAADASLVIRM